MKGTTKEEASQTQHVDEMRERMRMLQSDRKANMDIMETNKNANKEEMKRLREDNKDLRQKYAALQRTTGQEGDQDEQKHIAKEVEKMRRQYDELKLDASRHRKELEKLRDTVHSLELDSQRPHMEDNEFTRSIRALENKLDKAMIKYNEAQSIKKTYEQIVRRLREERVGFDNQLAAIERTLAAKHKDYEELLLLSGDANHSRETAFGELDRVRSGYEEERRRRERELRERHQVVQMRRQMLERMQQREKLRFQLIKQQEQLEFDAQNAGNGVSQKMLANEKLETRNKIDVFENAFRKIKEATGVSDVNEVIQKIVSQESTTENLIALTRENQTKIEVLYETRRKLKIRVEEVKYTGVAGGHKRKIVDDQEDQLASCMSRLDRGRLKYERLNKVMISMKAGVGHLQDKLESVRDECGGSGKKYEVADDTVAEILRECETSLGNVIRRIKAAEDDMRHAKMTSFSVTSEAPKSMGNTQNSMAATVDVSSVEEMDLNTSRPFNQRIDLLSLRDDDDEEEEVGMGIGRYVGDIGDDGGDDELTRDNVKRASTKILQALNKRRPKKGGRGKAE